MAAALVVPAFDACKELLAGGGVISGHALARDFILELADGAFHPGVVIGVARPAHAGLAAGKNAAPSAAILDSRTLQSTPESGGRAGFDGAKKRKGSKVHAAVDTLGHLLALKVTAANEQDRAQVGDLAQAVQAATGENVALAYVDQGCTGEKLAAAAQEHGLRLEVVKHHEAKHGFVLLPRRWVVERTFAWAAHFRRLARDYERLAETLAAYHWLALVTLMLPLLLAKSA